MKQPLSDELRVRHILDAIAEINSYLQMVSLEAFLSNSEKRFATIKQLEINLPVLKAQFLKVLNEVKDL